MKSIFTRVSLIAGLTALLSIAAFAQTTAPQSDRDDEGRGGRRGRIGRGGRMYGEREGGGRGMAERRALGRLNLSDAQRGRIREIEARYAENFKAQRLEIRQLIELREQGTALTPEQRQRMKQLRGELRDSAEKMRAEFLALLTPEQRDQLKQMREEGEARRKQRREASGRQPDNE
jgi:Spy/CpxP family protein refolding chaperone